MMVDGSNWMKMNKMLNKWWWHEPDKEFTSWPSRRLDEEFEENTEERMSHESSPNGATSPGSTTTTSTPTTLTTEGDDRTLRQVRENEEKLRKENVALKSTLNQWMMDKGKTIREGGAKPGDEGFDTVNWSKCALYAKKTVTHIKFLPDGWEKWHTDKRSMAQRILAVCTIPDGLDRRGYYETKLVNYFYSKRRGLKSNYLTYLREAYIGENFVDDICFRI